VPVSSTVIPLPVYKVGFGVGVNGTGKKPMKPDEATKLLTGIFWFRMFKIFLCCKERLQSNPFCLV
jgi:hypothetical protein